MKVLAALFCKANELPKRLEEQLEMSVHLAKCIVKRSELPTKAEYVAVHAQLARLIREGKPKPANDEESE